MDGVAQMARGRVRSNRVRQWLASYPRAIPLAIFLAIAAITALSVFAIERSSGESERVEMRKFAQTVAIAIEQYGDSHIAYLRAAAVLFSNVDDVDAELFDRFTRDIDFDKEFRGSDGIGWAPVESADALSVPVKWLAPDNDRNRKAIGYDMYSEPTRRAAMDDATRLGAPTASGQVVLRQEGGADAGGFLIYLPVFAGEGADRNLKGFVYSPFNANHLLSSAIATTTNENFGAILYDGLISEGQVLAQRLPNRLHGTTLTRDVRVADRPWQLVVEAPATGVLAPLSMVVLLFGLAVASLLMLLSRLLSKQSIEAQEKLAFLEEQNSIRTSLTRELNHRVKNALANILSILSLTRRRTDDIDEFADGLEGRIRSLSATHDLLTNSEWGTTPIRSVIEAEMAHFSKSHDAAVALEGPQVDLAPNDALSFGLALHELATNAAKYGALSVGEGSISIKWDLTEPNLAEVEWLESGGPPVKAERNTGFGTELIQKIVAHELRHPVELEFDPSGVRCVLRVPVRRRSEFQIREQQSSS